MGRLPPFPSPWTPEQVQWLRRLGYLLLALIVFFFLWRIRPILQIFLIGFFLAYLLDPLVDRLQEKGFSRTGATVVVFLAFFTVALSLLLLFLPPLVDQVTTLIQACLPPKGRYYLLALDFLDFVGEKVMRGDIPPFLEQATRQILQQLGTFLLNRLQGTLATLTGLFSLILLPFIVFYALQIVDPLRERLCWWVPAEYREPLRELGRSIGRLVGRYVRGYVVLCVAVGVVSLAFLLICRQLFGINYILALALLSGATYAIPYFGAWVTVLTGGFVAFTTAQGTSWLSALVVASGLLVINQAFDWLITPRVIGQRIGLHPLTVLFAVMAGGAMFGILGMLLAVPFAGAAKLTLQTLFPRHFAPIPGPEADVKIKAGTRKEQRGGQ